MTRDGPEGPGMRHSASRGTRHQRDVQPLMLFRLENELLRHGRMYKSGDAPILFPVESGFESAFGLEFGIETGSLAGSVLGFSPGLMRARGSAWYPAGVGATSTRLGRGVGPCSGRGRLWVLLGPGRSRYGAGPNSESVRGRSGLGVGRGSG